MSAVEVLRDDGWRLWLRFPDGTGADYHAEQVDVFDDQAEDPLDAARRMFGERVTPHVRWVLSEPERWIRSEPPGGVITMRQTDDPLVAFFDRIVWRIWCYPRPRRWRVDAPGLHTRPRRLS